MLTWLVAAVAGVAAAVLSYGQRPKGLARVAAVLRAITVTGVVALLLDAAVGLQRRAKPIVALDVSASWLRGRDSTAFEGALSAARREASDSLLIFGDSLRGLHAPGRGPVDVASRVHPVVEHALAVGRPLALYTDGELDDPNTLSGLPQGSRVVVTPAPSVRDAALTDLRVPRAVVAGDTLDAVLTVSAGAGGAERGRVLVTLGARQAPPVTLDSLGPYGERTLHARMLIPPGSAGATLLQAVVASEGDVEHRNDTLAVAIDLSPGAGAVIVSTSPDLDVRELTAVLRGTVSLPTRGFFRVAPGVWREEGSMAAVSEETVRQFARVAPMLVLHGDTAVFGDPRSGTRGSLLLFAPPKESTGEWYATGAPPSPVASALTGSAWDSLPPLDVSPNLPSGESEVLETRRARRLERRVAIVAWERPRRIVVVGASGFWRWRFRGGVGVGIHTALWGSVLDWLASEHSDARAMVPVEGTVRAGSPIRWRRGSSADSVVQAVLVRRGDLKTDTVVVRFAPGISTTETPARARGIYDVQIRGGTAVLAVNESAELLPRRSVVSTGNVGAGAVLGDTPHIRGLGWLFVGLVVALCAEWLVRRQAGLR